MLVRDDAPVFAEALIDGAAEVCLIFHLLDDPERSADAKARVVGWARGYVCSIADEENIGFKVSVRSAAYGPHAHLVPAGMAKERACHAKKVHGNMHIPTHDAR